MRRTAVLPAEPPSGRAAWYGICYTISPAPGEDIEPFKFSNIYVPSADRVRERAEGGGPAWFEPGAEFVAALRPYLERVSAFPASRLRATAEPARAEATPRPAPPPAAHAGGEDGAARTWILVAASLCALVVVGVIARGRRGSLAT